MPGGEPVDARRARLAELAESAVEIGRGDVGRVRAPPAAEVPFGVGPAAGLSGRANELTSYGGWIWFCSRVVYLPAYASGLRWLRSIVWGVATIAIAAMALGLVLGAS